MQLQALNWLNISQMNLFSRRQITVAVVVDVISSPDRFFPFLFVVAEKKIWWISVGCFVLQTAKFWESLIGVDNYKAFLTKCQ